ncbi:hypothetical protein LXL04_027054 [Taraxacum kok-saghyz]
MTMDLNEVLEVQIRSSYLLFFVLYSDFAESTSSIIPTVPKSGSGAQNRNQEEAEEAGAAGGCGRNCMRDCCLPGVCYNAFPFLLCCLPGVWYFMNL